jgi:DNA-directed RNA polymerase alpha subunit
MKNRKSKAFKHSIQKVKKFLLSISEEIAPTPEGKKLENLLDALIEDLEQEMSVGLYNSLRQAKILNLRSLVEDWKIEEILGLPGFGIGRLTELISLLVSKGLKLKFEEE